MHSCVWPEVFICVTWLSQMCSMTRAYVTWHRAEYLIEWGMMCVCDVTYSYVWHDSFIRVTWRIHPCDMTQGSGFTRVVTLYIYICDMTHSCVWYDSFINATWLIYMCDMTQDCGHTREWVHSVRRTRDWLLYVFDVTHSYVWHDSCTCVTWLMHMSDVTHLCLWHDSFTCVTWLRAVDILGWGLTQRDARVTSFGPAAKRQVQSKILKSQLATKFAIQNDY